VKEQFTVSPAKANGPPSEPASHEKQKLKKTKGPLCCEELIRKD